MAHSVVLLTIFVDGKRAQKKMSVSSKSSVEYLVDKLINAKVIDDCCVSLYNAQSQKLKLRDKVGKCLKDGQQVIVNTIGSPARLVTVHSPEPTFSTLDKSQIVKSTSRRKAVKKHKADNIIYECEHSNGNENKVGSESVELVGSAKTRTVDHKSEDIEEEDVGHPIRKVRYRRKRNEDDARNDTQQKLTPHPAAGTDTQQKLTPHPAAGTDSHQQLPVTPHPAARTDSQQKLTLMCDELHGTCNGGNLLNDVVSSDDDVVIVKVTGEKDISKKKLISNIKVYLRRHHLLNKVDINCVMAELQRIFQRDLSDRYNLIESIVHNLLDNPSSWLEEDHRMTSYTAVVGSYQLSTQDLQTLHASNWLNDNVINAYHQLLMSRHRDVFVFSTYFYTKLRMNGYESVKKWAKKTNLFTKNLVLFPIHGGNHWMLVVCRMADKTLIYLDSMQGRCSRNCLQLLISYIEKEAFIHECFEMIGGWKAKYMKGIPVQTNGYDCGVFVCQYSKLLLQKWKLDFSQRDIPEIRQQMFTELVNNQLL